MALTKLGVRRGDVVALGTEKRILVIPTIIGVFMTGATYTPYDLEIGRGREVLLGIISLFYKVLPGKIFLTPFYFILFLLLQLFYAML